MELLEIKIIRFKELLYGILLGEGTQWTLTKAQKGDYMLDGYNFINNKYIVYKNCIPESTKEYKILSIKNESEEKKYDDGFDDPSILNDYRSLFTFCKEKDVLVSVYLHSQDFIYVGKIKEVRSNSFVMEKYDVNMTIFDYENISFEKIRNLAMHTDYLESLNLLLDDENSDFRQDDNRQKSIEFVETKIKRFTTPINGIVLGQGMQWTLTEDIFEYRKDGYKFINNKFIQYRNSVPETTTTHKIMSIKDRTEKKNYVEGLDDPSILNDYSSLFSFCKMNNLLVSFYLHKENVFYVGKIIEVRTDSFVAKMYSPNLKYLGDKKTPFERVRCLEIHTDYLDSLSLVLGDSE